MQGSMQVSYIPRFTLLDSGKNHSHPRSFEVVKESIVAYEEICRETRKDSQDKPMQSQTHYGIMLDDIVHLDTLSLG